jgi:hypothetical protein
MDAEQPSPAPEIQPEIAPPVPRLASASWLRKFSIVVFIVFCFEIGLFLLIYPWMDAWTENTISLLGRGEYELTWRQIWNDPYFRGAVSGVGILNLWIAIAELLGMFRHDDLKPKL